MTAMLPAHLTETLNNLGDAAMALTDEVRADRGRREEEARAVAASQHRQNRIMVALLVIVALLVGGLLTMGLQNRARSSQNAQILRETAVTSERIADCTTVGGTCYQQSAARTGQAVQMIVRAQIYLSGCQKIADTDAEVEQCVMRRLLASETPTPSRSPSAAPSVAPASPR